MVWKAFDTRLGRQVALKVLPTELTADPERRRRMLREARAAAAVTHPNIATIYEVGEFEGITFISMELVEGRTLRSVIGSGPMKIPKALRLGAEIAEGLVRAHQAGIVHRDLKPDNILIGADGRPKILDFGLAKIVEQQREVLHSPLSEQETRTEELTREGTILGTPAYMSPEQVRGEEVDSRSDIFSFGVVLYEMVTGRVPFKGRTRIETLAAILNEPAVAASRLNGQVPARLDEVLEKCLDKDGRDRYQSCQDLVVDLRRLGREPESPSSRSYAGSQADPPATAATRTPARRWIGWTAGALALLLTGVIGAWLVRSQRAVNSGAGAGQPAGESTAARGTKIASIAVLPFVNMSGDKDNEYFSDGMAEELLNALAKNPSLRVAARTSSFSFKGKEVGIAEIGRRLNVASIVEGSVRKQGDQVRITIQLINAADGYHIWSETYDRRLEKIFEVQDDIARSVMTSLKATLPDGGTAGQRTGNLEAYNLRLRADYFWRRSNPGDLEKARDLYKHSLTLDPDSGRAWLMLGWTYINMIGWGTLGSEEGRRLARDATERALALQDSQAAAHAQLGYEKMFYEWDWSGAEAELDRAQALDPREFAVLHTRAQLAWVYGRLEEADELLRQLQEIDPLNKLVLGSSAVVLYAAGRLDEALATARMLLELDEKREGSHALVGAILLAQDKPDAALQEFLQEPSQPSRLYGLVQVYHALGRKADSDRALAEFVKTKDVSAQAIACVHAVRGEADEAFASLDRAYVKRDSALVWLKTDPALANLRSDPRWPPLLRKMRLAD